MRKTDNATSMMAEIIRKTRLISVPIWLTTIANLVLLAAYHGNEYGWLCFLTCMLTFQFTFFGKFIVYIPSSDNENSMSDILTIQARGQASFLSSHYHSSPFSSQDLGRQTGSIDVTWNLSYLTYLTGPPTNHETPNEQKYSNRDTNFGVSSLDIRARESPQVLDQPPFEASQCPTVAPAYRMNETAAWATSSGSVSSFP